MKIESNMNLMNFASKRNPFYIIKYIIALAIIFSLNSCIVVKHEGEVSDIAPSISLSPRPEIPMSTEMVISSGGDMVAFLPEEWFFINVEEQASSDILAVAVNSDYSLSLVFSQIRKTSEINKAMEEEGLIGLARLTLDQHKMKTGGAVSQTGKFQEIEMGIHNFVSYSFTSPSKPFPATAAVYRSLLGNYYQLAVVPMDIKGKPVPNANEIERIFRSVLAAMQFE